ncbi:MAG: AzlC family ABC transporter permease [Betaproteobacteria bacterium]|nr:AzlC family ABC transporter permease [Betaproteobacteria bacterium]
MNAAAEGSGRRAALRDGVLAAAGVPALVLITGYLGFGALAAGNGLSLPGTVLSTLLLWALPGQLILVEMHTLGAPFALVLLTVMFSAVRFLPMTVVLMPLLREARERPLHYYAAAQFLSMSGWAWTMTRFPDMAPERRLPYFLGFAGTLMLAATLATAAGFVGGDLLPKLAKLAMVFMSPMYFLLLMTGEARQLMARLSLLCGAVAGPLLHLVAPHASVLAGGLIGGTVAYGVHRAWRNRSARLGAR